MVVKNGEVQVEKHVESTQRKSAKKKQKRWQNHQPTDKARQPNDGALCMCDNFRGHKPTHAPQPTCQPTTTTAAIVVCDFFGIFAGFCGGQQLLLFGQVTVYSCSGVSAIRLQLYIYMCVWRSALLCGCAAADCDLCAAIVACHQRAMPVQSGNRASAGWLATLACSLTQ